MGYARTSLKGVYYYDSRRAGNGVTLLNPTEGKSVWLIDMLGRVVHRWNLPCPASCDARLLPNGTLLYAGKMEDIPLAEFEGAGGIILEADWDSRILWKYEDPYLHHASCRTRNGNTLVLKWVKVPRRIADRVRGGEAGTEKDGAMWGDSIQEITPEGKVVWEWIAHEQLDPKQFPRCPICPRSTWTHANAVTQVDDDNVLVSFMKSNTLAIIEKKTGKVIWQWGYPQLSHQHCPTILDNGNVLLFDNGMHTTGFCWGFSRILEVSPRTDEIVWRYGGEADAAEFYSSTMGSCQRLPNGNTLICESTAGRIFEVNPRGEMVWEFGNNLSPEEPSFAEKRSQMVYSAYRHGIHYAGIRNPVPPVTEVEPAPGIQAEKEEALKERLAHLGY